MLKRRLARLEQNCTDRENSHLKLCLVRINKNENRMRIKEFEFTGTIEEGEELMQQHPRLYVIFNLPWPEWEKENVEAWCN